MKDLYKRGGNIRGGRKIIRNNVAIRGRKRGTQLVLLSLKSKGDELGIGNRGKRDLYGDVSLTRAKMYGKSTYVKLL